MFALLAVLGLLIVACGDDEATEAGSEVGGSEPTAAELASDAIAAATVGIADREGDIEAAAVGQLDFSAANADVCPDEFAEFNVPYPEDRSEAAALDEGIEARGQAIVECLYEADEPDLAEDLALLTAWSRHLADQG